MSADRSEPRVEVDRYDRELLVDVLIYHPRTSASGCHCGWGTLGASYAEHVADVYEQAVSGTATRG